MATNGRLDTSTLTRVDGWALLENETASAFGAISRDLIAVGQPVMHITSPDGAYRTYDRQVYWKAYWTARGLPLNAATPGYSNHGWGLCWDIDNVAQFHRPTLVAIAARHGVVFDVATELWHGHRTGPANAAIAAGTGATPIATPTGKSRAMYLWHDTNGTIGLMTENGMIGIAQPSHVDLFLRVFNHYPNYDTFNPAERDIMNGYIQAANAKPDAIMAAIKAIPAFDSAAAATAIANTLKAQGVVVDYAKVAAAVDTQLADNFAAVDAHSKTQTDAIAAALVKVGTIDNAAIAAAVERAVGESGVSITPQVAGTIAGAVRAAIAPDLVQLQLKNQLA